MSLLNINSANQNEQSGKQVVVFQSGGAVQVVISPSLTSTTFANVLDPDTDTRAIGNNSLSVLNYNYGYNEAADSFARLRVVPTSGGLGSAISGSFALLVTTPQLSGNNYPLVGIRDEDRVVNVSLPNIDGKSIDSNSLDTVCFLYGFDSDWSRIGVNPHGDLSNTNTLATFRGPAGNNIDVQTNSDVTAASGGQTLSQIAVRGTLFIQARITNSGWLRIGGNNAGDFPTQTAGYQLAPGESIELHVENADQINVIAQVSGDAVNYIAEN